MSLSIVRSLCLAGLLTSQLVQSAELRIEQDEQLGSLSVYRQVQKTPLLTHQTNSDQRPFIHPLRDQWNLQFTMISLKVGRAFETV